jgi:hypothetical protein
MEKVRLEMERYRDRPLQAMWEDVVSGRLSKGWSQLAPIYQDICEKRPALFVWIIHSRDLSKVSADVRGRINWSKEQCKWSEAHPYTDQSYLNIADQFLAKMQAARRFSVIKVQIETKGHFPSTYHFVICDFKEGA